MNLRLQDIHLPLSEFTLKVDVLLKGRVTALFGASGSGKTTLLEIVAGLRRPASGRVQLSNSVLTDAGARLSVPVHRRDIGYVPQEGALFPHLSVRQNLLYGFTSKPERPAALSFAHVVEVLEIGTLADRRVATLSGGEKQRVAFGRALLAAPRLLLLDEPLAGLDLPLKERLLPYLGRIRDEFAIPMLYVTHAANEVMALCDEVLALDKGQVWFQGNPQEFFEPSQTVSYVVRAKS